MKRYRYRIYKGNELVLTNWIDAESKEKAIADLQELKQEYDGTLIKVNETSSAHNWKC